jgi:hypothetical protein
MGVRGPNVAVFCPKSRLQGMKPLLALLATLALCTRSVRAQFVMAVAPQTAAFSDWP